MGLTEKNQKGAEKEFAVISGGRIDMSAALAGEQETEIDLLDLAYVILDKIHYVIFFFLLGAVLLNAFSFFCIAPTYESVAKMYVVSASDDSVVDLTDLNIGTSLKADYEELMMSYPVLDQVIEKLELDMETEDLEKLVSITNPTDTRILKVTATTTDPVLSRNIANTMVEVSIDYLPKTMGTEEPNIAQEARLATKKSGPSYAKFTIIGAFLGALLCCAWFVFRYLIDDTLHTPEDVEKYFGIVPLTTIPDIAMIEENREKKRMFRRNNRGGKV